MKSNTISQRIVQPKPPPSQVCPCAFPYCGYSKSQLRWSLNLSCTQGIIFSIPSYECIRGKRPMSSFPFCSPAPSLFYCFLKMQKGNSQHPFLWWVSYNSSSTAVKMWGMLFCVNSVLTPNSGPSPALFPLLFRWWITSHHWSFVILG